MKGVVLFGTGALVHTAQSLGRHAHALLPAVLVDQRDLDQVRLELALGMALRVGNVVPGHRLLPRNGAYLCHYYSSFSGRHFSHGGLQSWKFPFHLDARIYIHACASLRANPGAPWWKYTRPEYGVSS